MAFAKYDAFLKIFTLKARSAFLRCGAVPGKLWAWSGLSCRGRLQKVSASSGLFIGHPYVFETPKVQSVSHFPGTRAVLNCESNCGCQATKSTKKESGKTGLCRFLRMVMNELGRTRGRIPAIFPGNVADSCGQVRGYRRKCGVFFQDNVTRKR